MCAATQQPVQTNICKTFAQLSTSVFSNSLLSLCRTDTQSKGVVKSFQNLNFILQFYAKVCGIG